MTIMIREADDILRKFLVPMLMAIIDLLSLCYIR